ncbi:MAG: hypothetical protein EXR72_24390 [Myxococcales bacterium]|nr:hypothetical protein [Myxococcales bacterium]
MSIARHRLHRLLAVGLAGLTLVGPILGTAHLAAVRHATCPEHGELLDVGGAVALPLAAAAAAAAEEPAWRAAESADHEHEDCAIAAHRRTSTWVGLAPPAALHNSAPTLVALQALSAPPGRRQSLYRLAPKTSPPA